MLIEKAVIIPVRSRRCQIAAVLRFGARFLALFVCTLQPIGAAKKFGPHVASGMFQVGKVVLQKIHSLAENRSTQTVAKQLQIWAIFNKYRNYVEKLLCFYPDLRNNSAPTGGVAGRGQNRWLKATHYRGSAVSA